jgi:hypothetical protein
MKLSNNFCVTSNLALIHFHKCNGRIRIHIFSASQMQVKNEFLHFGTFLIKNGTRLGCGKRNGWEIQLYENNILVRIIYLDTNRIMW